MTNFTKNTLATLALVLSAQTLTAGYTPLQHETLDVAEFSTTWNELYRADNRTHSELTATMTELLEQETLDVEAFASTSKALYQKETPSPSELTTKMSTLLEHSVATVDESCIESTELVKLSSL